MYYLNEFGYEFWHIFYFLSLLATMCVAAMAITNGLYRSGLKIGFDKPYWLNVPLILLSVTGILCLTPHGLMILYLIHIILFLEAPIGASLTATGLFIFTFFLSINLIFNFRTIK